MISLTEEFDYELKQSFPFHFLPYRLYNFWRFFNFHITHDKVIRQEISTQPSFRGFFEEG